MESVDRAQRRGRALRGAAAAAVATTLAATAHTLSGGAAPPAWLLVAVTLLATPIAVALTGRRPSLWRTGAVVAASQFLLHLAFATAGAADPRAVGHVHGAAPLLTAVDAGAVAIDVPMVAGHVLAAAITIALISRGERALRAIAAGLRHFARRIAVAAPRRAPRVPVLAVGRRITATAIALTSLSRRGPPALAR